MVDRTRDGVPVPGTDVPRVPLEDIPRLYVSDPQEGLKQIMRYLPGYTVKQGRAANPNWTETYTTDILDPHGTYVGGVMYVVTDNEEQKSQRIESWLKGLVQLAGTKAQLEPVVFLEPIVFPVPPVNPVKLALAGARVTPETDAPGGNCRHCLGMARHQAWCTVDTSGANKVQQPYDRRSWGSDSSESPPDAGDRLLAALTSRRNGTPK